MTDAHATTIMHAPADAPLRMHPMVSAAMAAGSLAADPTTLRELLAVQREWEAGEARKAYTRALAALKRDLPTVIAKDATVDYTGNSGRRTRYTHASLAGVMEAVTEPLTRHGFSLAWEPGNGNAGEVSVTCRLTHSEGHSEACTLKAPADTSGQKSSAQAVMSTITLLSRYTALALLGIATKDMKEPPPGDPTSGEAEPAIDTERNLRAAKKLADLGIPVADAERHIGRPVHEWTLADRNAMPAFVESRSRKRAVDAPPPPPPPPPADDAEAKRRADARARGEDPDA